MRRRRNCGAASFFVMGIIFAIMSGKQKTEQIFACSVLSFPLLNLIITMKMIKLP